nr:MAG TPA: hypothetical protein [Caudoviricetes sp.]DAT91328.1 MAG TPA: hypothetical protein [Caudoviricetes sp.]
MIISSIYHISRFVHQHRTGYFYLFSVRKTIPTIMPAIRPSPYLHYLLQYSATKTIRLNYR